MNWIKPPTHWKKWVPGLKENVKGAPEWFGKHFTAWEHPLAGLTVLRSLSTRENGERWIHVSVSRPDRIPTWEELGKVKREFIGEDIEAYQVLPAAKDYVNAHEYCLHLWAPADGVRRVANLRDLIHEEPI